MLKESELMYHRKKYLIRYTYDIKDGVFMHSIYKWDGDRWVMEELNNIARQQIFYNKICKKEKVSKKYKGFL